MGGVGDGDGAGGRLALAAEARRVGQKNQWVKQAQQQIGQNAKVSQGLATPPKVWPCQHCPLGQPWAHGPDHSIGTVLVCMRQFCYCKNTTNQTAETEPCSPGALHLHKNVSFKFKKKKDKGI